MVPDTFFWPGHEIRTAPYELEYPSSGLFEVLLKRPRMLGLFRLTGIAVTILAILPGALLAAHPATIAEAAAVLDLSTFPLIPGGASKALRRLANLDYTARSGVREAYAFQKKALEGQGWEEAPGGYLSDQSCSGSFVKEGYTISASASPAFGPDAAGLVDVRLSNHGNVEVGKLPVPPDAKPLYSFPTVAAYVTEKPVKETSEALSRLLTAEGWEPYGRAGDALSFKKNAVKISAWPSVAPAQSGKTVIQMSAELMSVDLPAPRDVIGASYADVTKALSLEVDGKPEALAAFYKDALGKAGWKATTDRPVKVDFREMLIFRNDAKDFLTLEMHESGGKLRAILEQRTAAEFEESMRLAQAEEAKRKAESAAYAKKDEEKRARDRVKVAIAVPDGASSVERTRDRLEFKLAAGEASAAVKTIHDALVKDGWKGKAPKFEPTAGSVSLAKKAGESVVIVYIDTGFGDSQVTISTFGSDIVSPKAK